MKFNIKLLEDNGTITKEILKAILPEATSFMDKSIAYIKQNLPNIIQQAIRSTPEYKSLLNGKLRYEFR